MNKWDKRHTFFLVTLFTQFMALIAYSSISIPPRLDTQRAKVLWILMISMLPCLWTIYLIVFSRNRFAQVLGWVSLIPTAYWLFSAIRLVVSSFSGH